MKKLIAGIALLFSLLNTQFTQAQSTALDFDMTDCKGNRQHLYGLLDSGYTVVLEYVMIPNCAPCITAGKGLKSVLESFQQSNPGKVKLIQIGYSDFYECTNLLNWQSTNGFPYPIREKGSAEVEYYGGMGMPTIVVAGPKDRAVYYVKQGYSPSENAKITIAINNSISGVSSISEWKALQIKLYPNPASENLTLFNLPEAATLRIMDISGKTLLEKEVQAGDVQLDISAFAKGMYIVSLDLKSGKHLQQPVILN